MSVLDAVRERDGRGSVRLVAVAPSDPIAAASASGRDGRTIAAAIALATIYATLRYNVFKRVPWADWPHYILNKVAGVAGLALLSLAALRMIRRKGSVAQLMTWGGGLALGHTAVSLALFDPTYFTRFFADGKLTLAAGLSLATGAVAFVLLEIGARRGSSWGQGRRNAAIVTLLVLSAFHAGVTAVATWFDFSQWPGGMPPLTLLSQLFVLPVLAAWTSRWPRRAR